jgi:2',3'-cyclic-nucleotide 2'-phosphodiesterase
MRLLFLGDVVGRSGREAVIRELPGMRQRLAPDFVVLNGENAAGGFGITEAIYESLVDAGVDVVTLGNHAFDQRETLVFIERVDNLLRPLNYPKGTPGRGAGIFTARNGGRVLVINVMGVVKMEPLADPFAAVDQELDTCPLKTGCDASLIDFHAELTSEKMALGHYVDGRASLMVGTHTHVPTSDHRILDGGTAYVTDAGMCGDYDSVIGMDKEEPLNRFLRKIPLGRFTPATGPATVTGIAVLTDGETGLALDVAPVRIGGRLEPAWPEW